MYYLLPETENRTLEDIELHFSDNSRKMTDIYIKKNSAKNNGHRNNVESFEKANRQKPILTISEIVEMNNKTPSVAGAEIQKMSNSEDEWLW